MSTKFLSKVVPVAVDSFVASGASHAPGFVPDPGSSAGTARFLREDASWAAPPGSDGLSGLVNAEVAVTTAATLGFGTWHVCSGTTANYTVTLPAPSGNAGKLLGVRMAPGLTKLVTLAPNAAETIDGFSSRVMWAGESAVLKCDGTNWSKVAGKSIPMACVLQRAAGNFTPTVSTWNVVAMDAQVLGPALMYDAVNGRISIARPGIYTCTSYIYLSFAGSNVGVYISYGIDAATNPAGYQLAYYSAGAVTGAFVGVSSLAAGDYVNATAYPLGGTSLAVLGPGAPATIAAIESPGW